MAQKVVFITTTGAGTYTIPNDFGSLVSVEAIGGGGSGDSSAGGGGGGGAYAKSTSVTGLTAGGTAYYQVGTTATDSWFNAASNAAPTLVSQGVLAKGGQTTGGNGAGLGGAAASCVGDVKYSGGDGGGSNGSTCAGGGGAAGPGGAGGTAGNSVNTATGGGGGASITNPGNNGVFDNRAGANGGIGSGGGAAGTAGTAGTGGGGGASTSGGSAPGAGGSGSTSFTQTSDSAVAGSGGGGGGGDGSDAGGNGGLYGGGGGAGTGSGTGAQGIIVFTYNLAEKTVFLTTTGTGTYKIPSDFVSLISVEAIGCGGNGAGGTPTNAAGGGGGAYAKSTTMSLTAGQTTYYNLPAGGAASDTWFNPTSNSKPTSNLSSGTSGIIAASGQAGSLATGGSGGLVIDSTGDVRYAGGNGGSASQCRGGGGGAGGPGGAGGTGGAGNGSTQISGGGGSGATLTVAGTAGQAGQASAGGAGGASAGQTGGSGATSSLAANNTAPANGGGGGGGFNSNNNLNGAAGSNGSYWTQTSDSSTAGSGGGGGGAGGAGGSSGANGGLYGAGGGGGNNGQFGTGAQGIIVITYAYNAALYQTKTVFFTTTGAGTYRIPNDFASFVSVEAIGGGGSTADGSDGAFGGAGGGAYAKSTSITLTAGQTTYYSVGVGGEPKNGVIKNGGDSWFNATSNAAPTLASQGVLAKGGSTTNTVTGGAGGSSASCVGDVKYSGGNGGDSGGAGAGNGAGGGAAGPGGAGGNGGTGSTTSKAGGGGGGGASLTAAGNNGSNASGDNGGNGGNGGGGTGGGTGGIGQNGTAGIAGTGGGGGGPAATTGGGGAGGTGSYWTQTSNLATAGSGGGGGGNRDSTSGGGNGGLYGGGASFESQGSQTCNGGQGIVVFRYVAFLGAVYPSPKPPSNFQKDDPIFGKVDLDDTYVTDAWLLEKYVGNNLFSWGLGQGGGIGDNTTADKSSPVQIGRLSTWRSVATAGGSVGNFSLVTKTDGTLWAVGSNNSGQLGTNNGTSYSSPVQVGTLTNWKQVSVGREFSAAVKTDNTLWTWGINAVGQLGGLAAGTGNTVTRSSPVQVGTAYSWKQVNVGGGNATQYTMAVANDGGLWAIGGINTFGQLGDDTTIRKSSPVQIGSLTTWSSVSAGFQHTMAIQTDGTLWGWGENTKGELGIPSYYYVSLSSPVQVGSLSNWSKLSGSMALKSDGTIWSWGINSTVGSDYSAFRLGLGDSVNRSSPVQIGSLSTWASIAGGGAAGFAITTGGAMWGWGEAGNGGLGDGTVVDKSTPVQIGTVTTWSKVSTNSYWINPSSGAIKTDGTLWTWGTNDKGQLGLGNTVARSTPVQVGTLTTWSSISFSHGSNAYALAITTDGKLWAWGAGIGGLHGTGNTTNKSTPVQVGTLSIWSQAEAGSSASFGITTTGALYSWGQNVNGQLGLGTTVNVSTPVQIGTLTDWSKVSAGVTGAAAIKTDGTLWTWGGNTNGALGDGTTVAKSSPVQIGSLTNWAEVEVGDGVMVAVKTDGSLWSWGTNGAATIYGALGTSLPDDRYYSSPIQIGQLTNWKSVVANYDYTLALKTNNTLWAWGSNASGNLGDGTTVDKQSPIQVGFLTDWKSIAALSTSTGTGPAPSAAVKTDGTLWTWGIGTSGVLGSGATTSRSSPVQVGLQTNWKQVSFSDNFSGKGITFNDI